MEIGTSLHHSKPVKSIHQHVCIRWWIYVSTLVLQHFLFMVSSSMSNLAWKYIQYMQEVLKIIKIMKLSIFKKYKQWFYKNTGTTVYINDKTSYSWIPFIVISHCGPSKLHDETVFACDACSEENRSYRVIKIENFFFLNHKLAEMSNLTHINLNILILNLNKTLDLWPCNLKIN